MKKRLIITIIILFGIGIFYFNKFLIKNNRNPRINLIGLNLHSDSDVYVVKKTIKRFFGFNSFIKKDIRTKYRGDLEPFVLKTDLFSYDCSKIQKEFGKLTLYSYNTFRDINIYITENELYNDNLNVNGITFGNEIYINSNFLVEKVAIHEILHNYGLGHCSSYKCIMSNNPYRLTWNVKFNRPIFCKECREDLPDFLKSKL